MTEPTHHDGTITTDLRRHLDGMPKATEAMAFAKRAHEGQSRDDGSPYYLHPWQVALILINEAGVIDEDVLCAAFLHDVVEDCPDVDLEELRDSFGENVASMVSALTKPPKRLFDSKHARMAAYVDTVLAAGKGALHVKLADRLHNTRSWQGISSEKRERKLLETGEHVLTVSSERTDATAERLLVLLARSMVECLVATDSDLAQDRDPRQTFGSEDPRSCMWDSSAYKYSGTDPDLWKALVDGHPRRDAIIDAYMREAFPVVDRPRIGDDIKPFRPRTGLLLNLLRWGGSSGEPGSVMRAVPVVADQLHAEMDFPCVDSTDIDHRRHDSRQLIEAVAEVGAAFALAVRSKLMESPHPPEFADLSGLA